MCRACHGLPPFPRAQVNQSELAFRVLTRRYGAQLCYTPMFNSRNFVADAGYRKDVFKTCAGDRPLVVQVRHTGPPRCPIYPISSFLAAGSRY